jgi:osmotically-inducible protein OsmY
MYENYPRSSYRGEHREFDEDRPGEDRWRGRNRGGRFESDRDWSGRNREFGYGSTFRGDDYGQYRGSTPDYSRDYRRGSREHGYWPHEAQHSRYDRGASSYGYGAGQPYGEEGDSRYFTGQQGSWAVRSPYGAEGSRRYGADYREHGYGRHEEHDRGFWDRASDEVASWFGDEDAARRRESDHRGRGPKDYTRSDERIREDANDHLTDDPMVDASNVTVTVANGEVTLNGTVDTRAEKRRAEDCVERVSGVKHVQNNLRVEEKQTSGTYESNWALNRTSTAEGGTMTQGTAAQASKTTGKV